MSTRYSRLLWVAVFATLIAVALLLFPGTATPTNAATGTYTYCGLIPEQQFPWNTSDNFITVTLSQFNTTALHLSSATLTHVNVSATEWITQTLGATNNSTTTATVSGNSSAYLRVFAPDYPPSGTPPSGYLFQDAGTKVYSDHTFGAYESYQWPTAHYTQSDDSDSEIPITHTAPYVGNGTVDFPTYGLAGFGFLGIGSGNFIGIITTTATVQVCVTYTYNSTTAVTLSSFSADANTSNPMLFAGAGLLAVGMLGLAGWKLTH